MPNFEPLNIVESIVSTYIRSNGGEVTIDGFVLKIYPVERIRNFYLQFKDAPLVTLVGLAEGDIGGLMSCFPQIQHLTIRDMKIPNSITTSCF